jgi:uncharacterized damage-inducible protein DinB
MLATITLDTFDQLRQIIDQLSKEDYTKKINLLNGSSLGQHVRHVIEFYSCLSEGIESGIVDYDKRKRNLKIETNPNFALFVIEELLEVFCNKDFDEITLYSNINYNGQTINALSSVNRELIYLIEHSIHHYAIMNIALKNCFEHVVIPEGFGIAYSTIKHQQEALQAAH